MIALPHTFAFFQIKMAVMIMQPLMDQAKAFPTHLNRTNTPYIVTSLKEGVIVTQGHSPSQPSEKSWGRRQQLVPTRGVSRARLIGSKGRRFAQEAPGLTEYSSIRGTLWFHVPFKVLENQNFRGLVRKFIVLKSFQLSHLEPNSCKLGLGRSRAQVLQTQTKGSTQTKPKPRTLAHTRPQTFFFLSVSNGIRRISRSRARGH